MTTSNQLGDANELARRFVACKRFDWFAGMLNLRGFRVRGFTATGKPIFDTWGEFIVPAPEDDLPDMSDPAMDGYLLTLVAKHYPDCALQLARYSDGSADLDIFDTNGVNKFTSYERDGSTLGAILVAALEAAP